MKLANAFQRRQGLLTAAAVVALLALGFFYLALIVPAKFRGGDLNDLILAGQAGMQHGWASLYYRTGWQVFRGLPPLAWIYLPLGLASRGAAYAIWTGLMVGCLIGAWAVATPGSRKQRALWLLALLTSFPAVYDIGVGQPIPLALLILAVSARWAETRRPELSGAALAVALQIKPTLAFLAVPALLAARAYRAALTAVVTGAAFLTLYLAMAGPQFFSAYAHATAGFLGQQEGYAIPASLGPVITYGLRGAIAVAAVGAAWVSRDRLVALAAGVAGSLLASPYVHPHDLLVLFLPAWIVHRRAGPNMAVLAVGPLMVAWSLAPEATAAVLVGEAWLLAVICWIPWRALRPAPAADRTAPVQGSTAPALD